MSRLLSQLRLSLNSEFDGLVQVADIMPDSVSLSEQRIISDVRKISTDIDYIFFRRFLKDDARTSQPVAYVIDNSSNRLSKNALAALHLTLWLNGTIPLLYVDNDNCVDILSCVSKAVSSKIKDWDYQPLDRIFGNMQNIDEQLKRFSASRLADGSFWEDKRNKSYVDAKKSAHNILLEKIKYADKKIKGNENPVARRLLLLTLLIKYLEDRGVFATENDFFSKYAKDAKSFYDVLKNGGIENIKRLLKYLEERFNGDIFVVARKSKERLTTDMIQQIVNIIQTDRDETGQLYFWDIYNFAHIPIEVISHIYQYFTEKGQGAIFTPVLLVNLMIDQVMPLDLIKGNEKIFDPTCGSGIFLVSAFRRLAYVYQRKKKGKATPRQLVELLQKTIFGVELQGEAAYITSFSLALAVCDALRPDIIWNELKFEKLIGQNIFIGDFGERGDDAKKACKSDAGFDIIWGNPPFKEKLTPAIIRDLEKNNQTIPRNQLAYYVLKTCAEKYLCNTGKLCMIQPHGFLYNDKTTLMRCSFFEKYKISKILDFISVNGLFYDANTKAIAVQLSKDKATDTHKITHLTFRRTTAVSERICFELDHYDYHTVLQKQAIDKKFTWKANLLGGGRLNQLVKRFDDFNTIDEYLGKRGWIAREGYIVGEPKKKNENDNSIKINKQKPADWLYNKTLLTPRALKASGISQHDLARVSTRMFASPREKSIYQPPLMIVAEMDTLYSGFWESSFLAYTHEFFGIKALPTEKAQLKSFYMWFKNNRNILRSCLLLCGGRLLTGRATATQKKDVMNLPCFYEENFNLVPWEEELLDDIRVYMAEYVRKGQDSVLLQKTATDKDIDNYSQTFLRLMNKSYPRMKRIKYLKASDMALIAFTFSDSVDPLPELDNIDWTKKIRSVLSKEQSAFLQTKRVLRVFTGNTLIIIKPDKLRYWIRSTAIRDVDDVIVDIFKGRN